MTKQRKQRRARKKGLKADYRGANPEQVAEAVLRFRTQPGMAGPQEVRQPVTVDQRPSSGPCHSRI